MLLLLLIVSSNVAVYHKKTALACLKSVEVASDISSGNFNLSIDTYFAFFFLKIICFIAS